MNSSIFILFTTLWQILRILSGMLKIFKIYVKEKKERMKEGGKKEEQYNLFHLWDKLTFRNISGLTWNKDFLEDWKISKKIILEEQ